jgi:hypothetical protein
MSLGLDGDLWNDDGAFAKYFVRNMPQEEVDEYHESDVDVWLSFLPKPSTAY